MTSQKEPMTHNVCYALPHFDVSYWIQIDRGDFPCTDMVGEFSIIDDSFQVSTYGTHVSSDFSFLKNYALRRCFSEFDRNLPPRYDGVSRSYAVLDQNIPPFSVCHFFHCRCYFESEEFSPVDFDLSLDLGELKQPTRKENNNANQH